MKYVEQGAKSNFQRGFSALAGISKIAQEQDLRAAASLAHRSRKTSDTCDRMALWIPLLQWAETKQSLQVRMSSGD